MLVCLFASAWFLSFSPSAAGKDDWPPIDPAELAMKDNPAAPGQHAMILARDVNIDDRNGFQTQYIRMKIFTEAGKENGNIEIPYIADFSSVDSIQARTIHADGKIFVFDGKPFDKMLVKAGGIRISAKTFTMPIG